MDLDDDFWEAEPEPPSRRPDPAVESAGARIREIYLQRPKAVFFVRQLELMLERDFFHWVTDFAIRDLHESGFLKDEYVPLSVERTRLRFLFRPSHRARRRQMKQAVALVRRYSEPTFAKACGRYAQELFLAALLRRGFRLEAENARSFRGLEWKESDHDLDFIISDAGVVYGCEVKNRLEYISREELSDQAEDVRVSWSKAGFYHARVAQDVQLRRGRGRRVRLDFRLPNLSPGARRLSKGRNRGVGTPRGVQLWNP